MKNNHKIGSIEYKLENIREEISKILPEIEKFRADFGKIMPIVSIRFGGWEKEGSIEGGPYSDLDRYIAWGSWFRFDPLNKEHVQKSYDAAILWIEGAKKTASMWHEKNVEAIENNTKLIEKIRGFMDSVGIPRTYRVKEKVSSRSKREEWVTRIASYESDIARNIPIDDGYESVKRKLEDHLIHCKKWLEDKNKKIKEAEREKKKKDDELLLLAKCLEIAKENNLTYSSNDELIGLATELEREKYVSENFPDGTEMDHKCCDSCGSWVIGERRCVCGNRRMELTIDGDILKGFWAYAEAY